MIDSKRIPHEVRENHRRLKTCRSHLFIFPRTKIELIEVRRVSCERCGGTMEKLHAIAYAEGFVAAGGAPTDVLRDGFPLVGEWDE